MSDKLQVLRSQAKVSMQSLVDQALYQDEISRYMRIRHKHAYRNLCMGISIPFAVLLFAKFFEMGNFHRQFNVGLSTLFIIHGKQVRELYAPEIFARDQKLRPYEADQFS